MMPTTFLGTFLIGILALFGGALAGNVEVPAAIEVGETAPVEGLWTGEGEKFIPDFSTSPTMLLFLKPRDRYASQSVKALTGVLGGTPELDNGIEKIVILTRLRREVDPGILNTLKKKEWTILYDEDDKAYQGYKIIATPTIIFVNDEGKVASVHAGYDAGLADDVRKVIAGLTGVELPDAVFERAERPNMMLQMGRRMAERGLWERALGYYERAAEEESLSPAARLEVAALHIEIDQYEKAEQVLRELEAEVGNTPELEQMRGRIERKRAGEGEELEPPKVFR